ncbi:MAG: hypothetical protein VKN15_02870, partial [Cyanobacteriota bacterium]|nr:hypothetical protein [Cyanobacteriota bacterium]
MAETGSPVAAPAVPASTAAEQALAAMRAAVFGADPMAAPPPLAPSIAAPSDPAAAINNTPGGDQELGDFL